MANIKKDENKNEDTKDIWREMENFIGIKWRKKTKVETM